MISPPSSRPASSRCRAMSRRAPLLADTIAGEPVDMPGVTVATWDGKDAEGLIRQAVRDVRRGVQQQPVLQADRLRVLPRPLPADHAVRRSAARALRAQRRDAGRLPVRHAGPAARTAKPAAILKTYASGLRGVGHLLADTYHRRAIEMGFTHVIHALMHEDNVSRDSSDKHKATDLPALRADGACRLVKTR